MTQAQARASGLVTPSLPQLWLTAMLRVLVELVQIALSTFQMPRRRPAECHSDATPTVLPREKTSAQSQETNPVAASDSSPKALMVSSTQSVRPSNHEGVLKTQANRAGLFQRQFQEFQLCFQQDFQSNFQQDFQLTVPLLPTKVGTQGRTCGLLCLEATTPRHRSWIPAFADVSGVKHPA